MEPKTLIEAASPNGNLHAFVEQDDRVAHFYLWGGPESEFGTRTCWVRNIKPGPHTRNDIVSDMRAGRPPMLDRESCAHPSGAPKLDPTRLEIVWFEEGDAAALLEDDRILAVIPGWSGYNDFCGYARDCTSTSPICWPLADALATMTERVKHAKKFWASWDHTSSDDPWTKMQGAFMSAYEALGQYSNYYAIDGGAWPPKALLRVPRQEGTALVTLGVSLRPQPKIESAFDDPSPHRRIELGLCVAHPCVTDEFVSQMAGYVSGQSGLPWANYTWLGEGHTIPCDVFQQWPNGEFTSVLLTGLPPGAPNLAMPRFRGDEIRLLWLIPITDRERTYAIDHGSKELTDRLWSAGCTWAFQPRAEVVS
jgi:hypothetical protein